ARRRHFLLDDPLNARRERSKAIGEADPAGRRNGHRPSAPPIIGPNSSARRRRKGGSVMKRAPFDVVIIGAGAAGLAAARALSQAGWRLVLLEARPRIGGRILTLREEDTALPIELGAEFIHGNA